MMVRVLMAAFCLGACSEGGTPTGNAGAASSGGASPLGATPNDSGGRAPTSGGAASNAGEANADGGTANAGTGASGGGVAPLGGDAGALEPDGGATSATDAGGTLVSGSLEVAWMHGAADCSESTDPELQVHAYNATTYIIRQDKCRTFEAPFVYLLIGTETALLLDTGATNSPAIRDTVLPLVGERALLVAHTHAHGDHVASDARFVGPSTTVIGTNVGAVRAAFGIEPWPTDTAELDLGARVLDVLAIPGHEQSHIALYDRETGLLFTGDTLYPGLLFINDWATYRTSVQRLAQFVATHEISHVLGAHIEMTSTPGINYPYGSTHQPAEHVLELDAEHVLELDAALTTLGPTPPPGPVPREDFVIDPQ